MQSEMSVEIDKLSDDYLLGTSINQLADHFADKYSLEPPVLGEPEVERRREQQQVHNELRGGYYTVDVYVFELHFPFEGQASVLPLQASRFTLNPSEVDVKGGTLVAFYTTKEPNEDGLQRKLDAIVDRVREGVGWIAADVGGHNEGLRPLALAQLQRRRAKAEEGAKGLEGLTFKMRKREGQKNYAVAPVRRKVIPRPAASSPGSPAEPELPMAVYEEILRLAQNVVRVMERSPGTFSGLGEEALRDHILVQLNSQYEMAATGESFNAAGKTDILVRYEGRHIFIAECKIWAGEAGAGKAVDQLLSYLTWRDAKAALFFFSRNRDFTAVVDKMRSTLKTHPRFVREVVFEHESGFRCVFKHPQDDAREIYCTALAFSVPTA